MALQEKVNCQVATGTHIWSDGTVLHEVVLVDSQYKIFFKTYRTECSKECLLLYEKFLKVNQVIKRTQDEVYTVTNESNCITNEWHD